VCALEAIGATSMYIFLVPIRDEGSLIDTIKSDFLFFRGHFS
jgi:hypothetical protein